MQPAGDALAATPAIGNRLFKFTQTGAGGRWTAEMAQASVDFFNKHEDRPGAKAEWCLAVGTDIEAEVCHLQAEEGIKYFLVQQHQQSIP